MKGFRICNHDLKNWKEYYAKDASEVVNYAKCASFRDAFEIEWKTPVTGEYVTLVKKESGRVIFNSLFKIPTKFRELI